MTSLILIQHSEDLFGHRPNRFLAHGMAGHDPLVLRQVAKVGKIGPAHKAHDAARDLPCAAGNEQARNGHRLDQIELSLPVRQKFTSHSKSPRCLNNATAILAGRVNAVRKTVGNLPVIHNHLDHASVRFGGQLRRAA